MTRWVCFEDSTAEYWCRARHGSESAHPRVPTKLDNSTTLKAWMQSLGIDPAPEIPPYRAFLERYLPTGLHPEIDWWVEALEEIRNVGVESTEHADYLFSQLAPEPKNQLLHFLVRKFIEEEIWDEPAQLKLLLEQARALLIAPPAKNMIFVHGTRPRAAFAELVAAFSHAADVESVRLIGPLQLIDCEGQSARPRRPAVFTGGALQRLDTIAKHVARVCRERARAEVFLHAPSLHKEYLKLRLAALGVRSLDFFEESKPGSLSAPTTDSPDPDWQRTDLLQRLRCQTTIKLEHRLQLEQRVNRLELSAGKREQWLQVYEARFNDERLKNALDLSYEHGKKSKPKSLPSQTPTAFLFPWLGKVESEHRACFFEQAGLPTAENPVWSIDDKRKAQRLGFANPAIARTACVSNRAMFFLPEALDRAGTQTDTHAHTPAAPPGTQQTKAARHWELRESSQNTTVARKNSFQVALPQGAKPSLSATSAKQYLECPARYFFQSALSLHAARDPRTDLQLYFGVLAHKALELYFRPRMDTALQMRSLDQAFEQAYTETIREHSAWLRREILQVLWQRIAHSVAALEAQLDSVFGSRAIFGIELEFRLEWENTVLKGRIDRIDKTSDGNLLLLDYKTGTVDFTPNHLAAGRDFQPWFYLKAIEAQPEPRAGIVYYDLKGNSVSRGVLRSDCVDKKHVKAFVRGHVVDADTLAGLLQQAESHLRFVAQGIRAGEFTPKPQANVCQFCDHFLHCRHSACLEGVPR